MNAKNDTQMKKMTDFFNKFQTYLKQNLLTFLILGAILIVTFGFELFNLNLTIDEELAALRTQLNPGFITSGRWGLYLLTKSFFPKQVIPVIPLFFTLLCQSLSILFLLDLLKIEKQKERIIIASLGLVWPGLVFLYSFSFVNFAVGFGFLCISLSLFALVRAKNALRLLAALPIALVFSIYQPLAQPLVMVFIFYALYRWNDEYKNLFRFLLSALFALGLGYVLYYAVQQLFLFANNTQSSDYVSHYFDISGLFQNLSWYVQKLARLAYNIFVGDSSFYGIAIRSLPIFLMFAGILIFVTHYKNRIKNGNFILFLGLLGVFSILPFIGGVLTKGYIPYRSLLGVPIFLMGWAALALKYASPRAKVILGVLAVFTLFQFALSTNHLFASSAFAYEEDKLLAYQLVERIEDEKASASSGYIQYIEMIGYVDRPSTPLVSRIENIGASFFGWDQGNTSRVVNFLRVLGYSAPDALPVEKRAEFVSSGIQMPFWPAFGSVQIIGNTVLVKFSPYSETQIKEICEYEGDYSLPDHFCPKD